MEETVEDRVDVKCNGGVEEGVKSKQNVAGVAENGRGLEDDPELDQLLDCKGSNYTFHSNLNNNICGIEIGILN